MEVGIDLNRRFIGPKEKTSKPKKIGKVNNKGESKQYYRNLPKYLSYKAALLREQQTLRLLIAILSALLTVTFIWSRYEILELQERLRVKEYILAPGVSDFTPASPQQVSDRYVADAVSDFVTNLGNISASTIDEQYGSVKSFMSDKLKIEFDLDTDAWVRQVKKEQISQILEVTSRRIKSSGDGWYEANIRGQANFYSRGDYLGFENQAIKMTLKLVPPKSGKRWYLQIESLNWDREEAYQAKKRIAQ
ncbi:MAG: hypothetical protein HRU19_02900 [Pseudobacteriovorax sp.]|nr:hypothetical protein [Pseudobacteriovorax sp.]